MQNLIKIHLINYLKVSNGKAEEAKLYLKNEGYLNEDFLPIKEDNWIFWPLNQDSVSFEGTIVKRAGLSYTKTSRDYRLSLDKNIRDLAPRSFDIFGEIAIVRITDDAQVHEKEIADALLLSHKNIKTVCVDMGVHGDFRIRELRIISGEDTFVSLHKENGMKFKADISKVYFSPRLATERHRVSMLVRKGEYVLDAFAGVAPFSISLAKKGCKLLSLDSNPEAKKWAVDNFKNNGLRSNQYSFYTTKFEDFDFDKNKFDRIVMNNPTNSIPHLKKAMDLVSDGGSIHLYHIASKNNSFDISDYLDLGFKCTLKREVHAYSPSSSLFVFDIGKNLH
jgi:tRNA (guanine37-N1)-methyltransferase